MPRIRTIKPEFWSNEALAAVSETAALLAIALLNYADDEGYFNARPALVRAFAFPIREPVTPVPRCIEELTLAGYIEIRQGADGRAIGHVKTFLRHQVVNHARPSVLAGDFNKTTVALPESYGSPTVGLPDSEQIPEDIQRQLDAQLPESYGSPTVVLPPGMELNGMELNGMEQDVVSRPEPPAEIPAPPPARKRRRAADGNGMADPVVLALVERWNALAKLRGWRAVRTPPAAGIAAIVAGALRRQSFRDSWTEALDELERGSAAFLAGENDRRWRADLTWFCRPGKDGGAEVISQILAGRWAARETAETKPEEKRDQIRDMVQTWTGR